MNEDIKKTINKIIFTHATTKQWQLLVGKFLLKKASECGCLGSRVWANALVECQSVNLRERQRSLWQWFNMTDSLECLPTLLHFHSQELVPVRASEHMAKGLMTHPLWINTTRSDALRDFGWRQLKLQRSQQNHRRQQGHDHSAQGQQQHHHLSSCLFGCFTTSRLPIDKICLFASSQTVTESKYL